MAQHTHVCSSAVHLKSIAMHSWNSKEMVLGCVAAHMLLRRPHDEANVFCLKALDWPDQRAELQKVWDFCVFLVLLAYKPVRLFLIKSTGISIEYPRVRPIVIHGSTAISSSMSQHTCCCAVHIKSYAMSSWSSIETDLMGFSWSCSCYSCLQFVLLFLKMLHRGFKSHIPFDMLVHSTNEIS